MGFVGRGTRAWVDPSTRRPTEPLAVRSVVASDASRRRRPAWADSYDRPMASAAPPRRAASAPSTWPRAAAGTGVWVVLVAVSLLTGSRLAASRPEMQISAAPFVGAWLWSVADREALHAAVALAVLVVVAGPALTRRLPWRAMVAGAGALAVVWLLALNAIDGPEALRSPLTTRYEYVAGVPDVEAAGGALPYLDTFTERIADYPTHVRGHPPGLVVGLWAADQVGLDPVEVSLALVLGGWGVAVASALVATREVAGERAARRVALLLALAPGAVWAGTSPDAFFAGLTAAGIAALVVASGREGRRADLVAAAGGLLLGASLLVSYGTGPALAVPVVVGLIRRRLRPLVVAAAVATASVLAVGLTGFWWPVGLQATAEQYRAGLSQVRPYRYFVYANLAAVAVAVGPALGGGLANLGRGVAPVGRRKVAWTRLPSTWGPGALALGAVVGVLAADLSGLSKGETERIWLVFVPWLATVAAFLPRRPDWAQRAWIAAQAAVGLGLQVALRSPW